MIDVDALRDAVRTRGSDLEAALVSGLQEYVERHGAEWSDWDVQKSVEEVALLSQGGDCTYDRPSVGVAYASWYHPKRTDDMMRILIDRFAEDVERLRIVDLGCGTGATAWAVVALNQARIDLGERPVEVTLVGCDTSPFMLGVARELWNALEDGRLSQAAAAVTFDLQVAHIPIVGSGTADLLTAGFFLDSSDHTQPAEVAFALHRIGARIGCREILVTTSWRKARSVLPAALEKLSDLGWAGRGHHDPPALLGGGSLRALGAFRRQFMGSRGVAASLRGRDPSWSDAWTDFHILERSADSEGLTLPFPIEGGLPEFDEDQLAVLRGRSRGPERIVGAAGSGKSLVLMYRVAETIRVGFSQLESPALEILVTCFNKSMVGVLVDMLREALEQRLPRTEIRLLNDGDGDSTLMVLDGPDAATVRLINLDKIPTRLLRRSYGSDPGRRGRVVGSVRARRRMTADEIDRYGHLLDEDFLLDEINCVIAGQGATSWEEYSTVQRHGRPHALPHRGRAREVIWDAVTDRRSAAFAYRWWNVVDEHRSALDRSEPIIASPYDWVFVDEAQDFTEYQLRVVASLAKTYRNLVIAIDQAQSIRIGPSFRRPRYPESWMRLHRLEGSYRLPVRIAEAARPLAEAIATMHRGSGTEPETYVPVARKASVLGFRPVVVAGGDDDSLIQALSTYIPFVPDAKALTILQANGDHPRFEALRSGCGLDVETAWVESIKGQERPVVLWHDGTLRSDEVGMAEVVYTVATRTTSLLVIVLDATATDAAKSLVGRFDPSRLLFWSQDAEKAWFECRDLVGSESDPLEGVELDEGVPALAGLDADPRSDDEVWSELCSESLPNDAAAVFTDGGVAVWLGSNGNVRVRIDGGTSQYTRSVYDEALRVWLDRERPIEVQSLGRISGSRVRPLIRLFSSTGHPDVGPTAGN